MVGVPLSEGAAQHTGVVVFGSPGSRSRLSLFGVFLFLHAGEALPQTPPAAPAPGGSAISTPAPEHLAVQADHENMLVIPRLPHGPALEDFLTMKPEGEIA